jgi:hypothetical protein
MRVLNRKKGFGLIAAIFILVLVSSLSAFLMNITTTQRRDISNNEVRMQLKFLAKSGMEQILNLAKRGLITNCGSWNSTGMIAGNNNTYLTISFRSTPIVTATIPCAPDTTASFSANSYGNMYHNGVYSIHYDSRKAANFQYFQNIPISVTASLGTFGAPGYVSYTTKAKAIVYYSSCTMSASASCPTANVKTTLVIPNSQ